MRIFVDGDACPVTKIVEEIAKGYELELIVVCDTSHMIHVDYGRVVIVSKGTDSVDFYIVNKVVKGDIIITNDYGVAAMGLAKGGYPISGSGKWYTNENIDLMLHERHMSKVARKSSVRYKSKGHKKRTHEDDMRFYDSLIELIQMDRG